MTVATNCDSDTSTWEKKDETAGSKAYFQNSVQPTSNGLIVEDVTEAYDSAYEGDVEGQLPYETQEADSDSEAASGAQTPRTSDGSLVREFRRLRCETPKPQTLLRSTPIAIQPRKRSRSQAKSDSESDAIVAASSASTPTFKRQRRRLKEMQNAESSTHETDDVMEVDISSPLQSF